MNATQARTISGTQYGRELRDRFVADMGHRPFEAKGPGIARWQEDVCGAIDASPDDVIDGPAWMREFNRAYFA